MSEKFQSGAMNYEQLVVKLTRIKKELDDIRVSTEADDTMVMLLHAFLHSTSIRLTYMVDFIKYKIKN